MDLILNAKLFIASQCPHCATMLAHSADLIKSNEIQKLEVINLDSQPDQARADGIRSVPVFRIGKYDLQGAQSIEAIRQRISWSLEDLKLKDKESDNNLVSQFDYQLSEAQVEKVVEHLKSKPEDIYAIMTLLGDSGTVLSSRIGIGVIMEEFEGSELIQSLIPQFSDLSTHKDKRIRADVCYYLGLTQSKTASEILEVLLGKEKDPEVIEAIQDSLEDLRNTVTS